MVRTVRSIEEEARVRQVSGVGLDAFLADPYLRDLIEGPNIASVVAWAVDGGRRVLVVGLEDRGRLALALAEAGMFVTVVEPNEALHAPVRAMAEEGKFSMRMNFYASEYMQRDFAASGFDVAVFFSVLSRYNEPVVVLKKAARELRAGGRVFARIRTRPPVSAVNSMATRIHAIERVVRHAQDRISEVVSRIPGLATLAGLPEAEDFLRQTGEVFKLTASARMHLLAPVGGWLASRDPTLRRLVPALLRLDKAILRLPRTEALALYCQVFGTKELGLGRTFRLM